MDYYGENFLIVRKINTAYPSISDLREKAKKKIPKFAFEYLDGGCNEDINRIKNSRAQKLDLFRSLRDALEARIRERLTPQ